MLSTNMKQLAINAESKLHYIIFDYICDIINYIKYIQNCPILLKFQNLTFENNFMFHEHKK